ncbi:hypothetical protein [Solidesulfovibrio sp.]
MEGDTDILDAMPRQCGMCERWERDPHRMERGRCPEREEAARAALADGGISAPLAVHICMGSDADATLCVDFEWTDAALSEAVAIARYHATRDEQRRAR